MKILRLFRNVLIAVVLLALALICYIIFDNSRIINTEFIFKSEKVPKSFDGYKIALISDFHNSPDFSRLAEAVREASPDIICIAGDLVNMDTKNFTNAKKLVRELTGIATVYFTYGNHEQWSKGINNTNTPLIADELDGMGVVMLNNKVKKIEKDGQFFNLAGYGDSIYDDSSEHFERHAQEFLKKLSDSADNSALSVLVFHRAQYFDLISQYPFDLVLSGHLHGGQVNIPKIREKILETYFGTAKYVKGEYTQNGKKMIVCGGTAQKDSMYRVFNTPEFVTVELKAQ